VRTFEYPREREYRRRRLGKAYLSAQPKVVMPGLVPGIHVLSQERQDVDGRDKPGHDAER
jgi:beta-N-acetylhexosaminidase